MTQPLPGPADHSESGFTVLELLVSLVLVALLMMTVPGAILLAQRSQMAAAGLDRATAVETAMGFIEQRLTEATAIYERGEDGRLQILFRGAPDGVTFIAPVTFTAADQGLARLEITSSSEGEGRVMMAWSPWRPKSPGGESETPPAAARTISLAGEATALALRYFGAPDPAEPPVWADVWRRTDASPDLVEFQISRAGDKANATRVRRVTLRLRLP